MGPESPTNAQPGATFFLDCLCAAFLVSSLEPWLLSPKPTPLRPQSQAFVSLRPSLLSSPTSSRSRSFLTSVLVNIPTLLNPLDTVSHRLRNTSSSHFH